MQIKGKKFSYDVSDTCFPRKLLRLNTIQRELDAEMDKENIQNLIVNSKLQGTTKAFFFMVWSQLWPLGLEGEFQSRAKFHSTI